MKAVSFKWQSLSSHQKEPFEQMSFEDKHRYERETAEFRKGTF
jgi:hypothetical protein